MTFDEIAAAEHRLASVMNLLGSIDLRAYLKVLGDSKPAPWTDEELRIWRLVDQLRAAFEQYSNPDPVPVKALHERWAESLNEDTLRALDGTRSMEALMALSNAVEEHVAEAVMLAGRRWP